MSYVEGSALRTFSKRSRTAIVALVATAMLASGLFLGLSSDNAQAAPLASVVDQTYCYGLDEGTGDATEDQQFLHEVVLEAGGANPTKIQPGAAATPVDPAGNIESIALRNDASEIYVWDPAANAMFEIDVDTATEVPATDFNLTGLGDIDAMFFQNDTDGNPGNDILWVVTDINDGVAGNVDADTLTGYNSAGLQVAGPVSLVLPVDTTVEGATWVPDTGEFLISYTTTAAAVASTLASLGTAAVPSSSPTVIGTTLVDVEGLGTDGAGAVFLTTGEDGVDANNFYHVDETAGATTSLLLDMAAGAPAGGDADFESIDCAWADITLDKAITSAVRNPDGTTELTYTFTITNTGELQLADVTLTDPMANFDVANGPTPDDINGDCSTAVAGGTQVLNIDESCTAVWIYTVNDGPGDYDNTASVSGTPPNGIAAEVTDTDTVTATIPAADQPVLEIVKTVVDATLPCPAPVAGLDTIPVATGDQVKYCIVVTNSGAGAATGVTVTDDLDAASPRAIGDLAPGASFPYDYTVTVGANPETNTAIVSGNDGDGNPVPTASDQAGTVQPAPGSISNFVFDDANGNGIQDAGEAGIPGVTVNLWSSDGAGNPVAQLNTTTTDANGEYIFAGLDAGDYVVQFVAPNGQDFSPADQGGDDAADSDADPADGITGNISLAAGEDNDTVDAGILPLSSISNFVFEDTNSDGIQDAGEPGFPGVTVNLWSSDGAGNPVAQLDTTTTDANGEYIFDNLPAGDYVVEFVAPGGRDFTALDQGGDDAADSDADPADGITGNIALGANEDNDTVDAGILPIAPLGSISNFVFEDTNSDGTQDAGEPGVPGVTVNLWSSDGAGNPVTQLASTTTDANGEYIFNNLAAGDYVVQFVAPGGRDFTALDQGGDDAVDSDADPADGITNNIALGAGEDNVDVDAGLLPIGGLVGSISNLVFEDTNQNDVQDAGEPGVPGVTVNLWSSDGAGNPVTQLASTTTDANGEYIFNNLAAGDYVVQFITPRDIVGQNVGGDEATDSDPDPATGITDNIALAAGEDNVDVDAGVDPINTLLGSISNFVFEDTNQNDLQDAGEPGVPGVTVNLWSSDGAGNPGTQLASTTTDANGEYLFPNLNAGDYVVQFVTPRDLVGQNAGDDTLDSDPDPATGITDNIALAQGEDNVDVDAGVDPIAPLGSISNFVFEDTNQNDLQDAGEPGVPGVTVNLWSSDGAGNPVTQLSSTTTDANGEYIFPNLAAGDYVVQFVTPRDIVGQNAGDDTLDSDPDPATGITDNIALAAGEDNVDVDAGLEPFVPPGSISNFVWIDSNDNGLQDAGEPGIQGVTVNLWSSDGAGAPVTQLSTTTTDANGEYIFPNLNAGDYVVQFIDPTGRGFVAQNVGADDTIDSDPDPADGITDNIALAQGEDNVDVDAGINPPPPDIATIGNFVWHDLNRDGIQDAGEPGVAGVTINVWETDAAGNIPMGATPTVVTTDADGLWTLDVTPGSYRTNVIVPTGFIGFTTQDVGDDATDSDIITSGGEFAFSPVYTVAAGETDLTIDAGLVDPVGVAELGNFVFEDVNQNGLQDAGEPGIANIVVQVLDGAGAVVGTDTTDANGEYLVTDLAPGTYTVSFINTTTGTFTTQNAGDDALDSDADASGQTAPVTLAEDDSNLTIDAGIVFTPELGSISNFVFEDTNQNGIQDAGEPGVAGVLVQVFEGASLVGTDTTDANGLYLVDNLPAGDYTVQFNVPGGRVFTTPNVGADDTVDSDPDATGRTAVIPLAADEDNIDVDAGLVPIIDALGSISNLVFEDTNGDGIQDAGEPGLAGVTVTVRNSLGAVVGTDTTDANGEYLIDDLPADTYTVEFTVPGGRDFTAQDVGDDTLDSDVNPATGITGDIVLGAGEDNEDVDAGVLPIVNPALGSISNLVFLDSNENGLQDAGEPGVQGVVVTVRDSGGTIVGTDVTDAAGAYSVGNLPAGDYTVEFDLPGALSFTTQDAGDDALDSDPNPATGVTGTITLAAGEDNDTVDAGVAPPPDAETGSISNIVFQDTNGNGIQDAGEPGVQGVQVIVYDSNGLPVGDTVTDGAGAYVIDNLPPGDYTVQFNLPGDLTFTTQNAGDGSNDSDPDPATGRTAVITLGAGENNVDIDAGVLVADNPAIGLAKTVVGTPTTVAGNTTVTYSFVIENLGDVTLSNIILTDNFDATFAGATVVSGPVPNGGTCSAEVAGAPGHTLAVGTSCVAIWDVVVSGLVPGTVYDNTATVTGTSPLGTQVFDISDDGIVPDTDDDGNANEDGENDPTPVSIPAPTPVIGLAKDLVGAPVFDGADMTVTYSFVITNLGETSLSGIILTDDFDATFAPATVVSGPTPAASGCSAAVAGAPGHILAAGASCTAVWTVVVQGWPLTDEATYNNTATVSGNAPDGSTVTDISDDGVAVDADGDGNPNEPGENDPTPLTINPGGGEEPGGPSGSCVSNSGVVLPDAQCVQYTYPGPFNNAPEMTPEPAAPVTAEPLAFTGSSANLLATLALALMGAGGALMIGARRRNEDA